MGFINHPNPVPEYQRKYQAAYKAHTRLWRIHPRSRFLLTPYYIILWGTAGISLVGMVRKVAGYNSYF